MLRHALSFRSSWGSIYPAKKTPLSSVVTASRDSDDSDEDAEDGADFDDYEEQEEDDMDGGKSVVGVGMSEAEEQLVSSFMNAGEYSLVRRRPIR